MLEALRLMETLKQKGCRGSAGAGWARRDVGLFRVVGLRVVAVDGMLVDRVL